MELLSWKSGITTKAKKPRMEADKITRTRKMARFSSMKTISRRAMHLGWTWAFQISFINDVFPQLRSQCFFYDVVLLWKEFFNAVLSCFVLVSSYTKITTSGPRRLKSFCPKCGAYLMAALIRLNTVSCFLWITTQSIFHGKQVQMRIIYHSWLVRVF